MPKMKPVKMVEGHRTKEEIEERAGLEEKLHTGQAMKEEAETKRSVLAHRTFLRIKKLLKSIDKDDAMYQAVINRYSQLHAETAKLIEFREKAENVDDWLAIDQKIAAKRKMLFDIEKENYMTLNSGMKAVSAQLGAAGGQAEGVLSSVLAGDFDDV